MIATTVQATSVHIMHIRAGSWVRELAGHRTRELGLDRTGPPAVEYENTELFPLSSLGQTSSCLLGLDSLCNCMRNLQLEKRDLIYTSLYPSHSNKTTSHERDDCHLPDQAMHLVIFPLKEPFLYGKLPLSS